MKDSIQKAKSVAFYKTGGPDVLELIDVDMPEPGVDEVLIKVKSIGLNRADLMYRMGRFVEAPVFPGKLGFEAAGLVEQIGAGLKNVFQKGDKVNVLPAFSLHNYGTYGDYVVVPGYAVRKFSDKLSFDEAAALWTSYVAMYGMLVDGGNIQKGDFVVINAASSSTGLAAIQLVDYCGGVSIALTSSSSKKDALLKAGAKYVIDASNTQFDTQIMGITGKRGVDIILDPVVGKSFSKLLSTIAEQGKVFVYGVLSSEEATFPAFTIMAKRPIIRGFSAGDIISDPEKLAKAIEFIQTAVDEEKIKPKIDRNFNLIEIVQAHTYMESNSQFGKVIVNP
jgi:NADPH:quinone reductase-like Zn-dependent oxidoreductase